MSDEQSSGKVQRAQRIVQWLIIIGILSLAVFSVAQAIASELKSKQVVFIGKAILRVEVADTAAARDKGLGGRSSLGSDEAMLLIFDSDDKWPVVMRGMKFPIDLIWLDKNKTVVDVRADVQPDAEPYNKYEPSGPARYVIEVAAGQAKQWGIKPGMTARFDGVK